MEGRERVRSATMRRRRSLVEAAEREWTDERLDEVCVVCVRVRVRVRERL